MVGSSTWEDKFLANLEQSNAKSLQFEEFYNAFAISAKRAVTNMEAQTIDPEYVSGLELQIKELRTRLESTIEQLNKAQSRNRDMIEEQYMKTHAVQQLNDEILALNLQLNVSQDKQAALHTENKELIERWVARVSEEANER